MNSERKRAIKREGEGERQLMERIRKFETKFKKQNGEVDRTQTQTETAGPQRRKQRERQMKSERKRAIKREGGMIVDGANQFETKWRGRQSTDTFTETAKPQREKHRLNTVCGGKEGGKGREPENQFRLIPSTFPPR